MGIFPDKQSDKPLILKTERKKGRKEVVKMKLNE